MADDFLPQEFQDRLREIGNADLVIGIPTHNNAATIQSVVTSLVAGLGKAFPNRRAVLINCDAGSHDGTSDMFEKAHSANVNTLYIEHPIPAVHPLITPEHGVPGYENAVRMLFHVAEELQAQACGLVNGNLKSVTPEWVGSLLSPIIERSFDFVAPIYRRHKNDGSLTNGIVYPMNRALYGKRIRYQSGGAYGFSQKLAAFYLTKDVWGGEIAQLGIESWMTTVALAEGFEVCHASLGKKVQDSRAAGGELAVVLSQAVGSVFSLMEEYEEVWELRKGSSPVPVFGVPAEVTTEPVHVNVERMVKAFRQGLRDLLPIWELILADETVAQVLPFGLLDVEEYRFPIEVWVQVIYDFALAYHEKVVHREHLLKALTPLYLGRTASFIMETKESNAEQVEQNIERLCEEYEAQKPSLTERWR